MTEFDRELLRQKLNHTIAILDHSLSDLVVLAEAAFVSRQSDARENACRLRNEAKWLLESIYWALK